MRLSQLLLIVRVRLRLILTVMMVIVGLTALASALLPRTYKATASVFLNYRGVDTVTGLAMPSQMMQSYLATQVGMISSRNVALKVVDSLGMPDDPVMRKEFEDKRDGLGDMREWLADRLLKNVAPIPSRESGIVDISFKWDDPDFAARVANAFAREYQQTTIEIKTDPLVEVGKYFNEQIKALRANLETAQSRLSQYQKDKGIVSVDIRLDVESVRLNELSSQLVAVQGQLIDAKHRQAQAQGARGAVSPDVIANPVVQALKASLTQAELRLVQVSSQFTADHPLYIRTKSEVDRTRAELANAIKNTSDSIANNAIVFKLREEELRAALQAQKEKVLELNRSRDELAVLGREVENAQRAYENTMNRFSQINLEGHAKLTDVTILSSAVAPIDASSPKFGLNILLSICFGLVAGIGAGVLAEMANRKVRSASDLLDILESPIIGVMELRSPKPKRMTAGGMRRPQLTAN